MSVVHVVAAVIYAPPADRILLAKRPDHLHKGGLWEFPGGKINDSENAREALARELREELAIHVESAHAFMEVTHHYPEKSVHLDIWQVHQFAGEPRGNEGQEIAWVSLGELRNYEFPEANAEIVEALLRG